MSRNQRLFIQIIPAILLAACGGAQDTSTIQANATTGAGPVCSVDALLQLPDVRISSATQEAAPVPHCKVAGVIGTETHFELLLPESWNGKFVMGGGGGFAARLSDRGGLRARVTRYKLTLEYDGTPFVGWQRQKNGASVQAERLHDAVHEESDPGHVARVLHETDEEEEQQDAALLLTIIKKGSKKKRSI